MLCFSDGTTVASFPPAQDYKKLNAESDAPNTGGMGAYCPVKHVSPWQLRKSFGQRVVV